MSPIREFMAGALAAQCAVVSAWAGAYWPEPPFLMFAGIAVVTGIAAAVFWNDPR